MDNDVMDVVCTAIHNYCEKYVENHPTAIITLPIESVAVEILGSYEDYMINEDYHGEPYNDEELETFTYDYIRENWRTFEED